MRIIPGLSSSFSLRSQASSPSPALFHRCHRHLLYFSNQSIEKPKPYQRGHSQSIHSVDLSPILLACCHPTSNQHPRLFFLTGISALSPLSLSLSLLFLSLSAVNHAFCQWKVFLTSALSASQHTNANPPPPPPLPFTLSPFELFFSSTQPPSLPFALHTASGLYELWSCKETNFSSPSASLSFPSHPSFIITLYLSPSLITF